MDFWIYLACFWFIGMVCILHFYSFHGKIVGSNSSNRLKDLLPSHIAMNKMPDSGDSILYLF